VTVDLITSGKLGTGQSRGSRNHCDNRLQRKRRALPVVRRDFDGAGRPRRHQLTIIIDVINHRELNGNRMWCAVIDITSALPTTDVYGIVTELRSRGVGGRLLRSVLAYISGLQYAHGIAPGVDAEPVSAGIGIFQGSVLSPRMLSIYVDDLARRLRVATNAEVRRIGVSFENAKDESLWCGCVLFMDDIFLLCDSREHLHLALDVMF
jgi:hypothetical protein